MGRANPVRDSTTRRRRIFRCVFGRNDDSRTCRPMVRRSPSSRRSRPVPSRIWLRPLSSLEPRPIPGTEGATSLFWAPDGRAIAFFTADKLMRINLTGGGAVPVCDILFQSIGLFGTWGADGDILFAAVSGQAIFRASRRRVGPRLLGIKTNPDLGESRIVWPWFLPDGRRFLYLNMHKDRTGWLMLGEQGKPGRRIPFRCHRTRSTIDLASLCLPRRVRSLASDSMRPVPPSGAANHFLSANRSVISRRRP